MAENQPLFSGGSTRFSLTVSEGESGAVQITAQLVKPEQPWEQPSEQQATTLTKSLSTAFGKDQVHIDTQPNGLTFTVTPPAGAVPADFHRQAVELVRDFAEDHSYELETGDEQHFQNLVTDAAAKHELRAGIMRILDDQLLDRDQKADALIALFSQRMGRHGRSSPN